MRPARQRGFTAIEALIVMAIAGILAAMAAPSMRTLLTTQSVKGISYDLISDLAYARGEAIARSANVVVTSTGGADWKRGWTITTGGNTIRSQSAKFGAYTASEKNSLASLTFNRTGRAGASLQVSIVPTDTGASDDMKRCVVLDPSGRVRSTTGAC